MKDVVNRLTFEFNCTSEAVATQVSDQVVHYHLDSLCKTVDEVFPSYDVTDAVWKIDRLELDLGDLSLSDIRSSDLRLMLRAALTNELSRQYAHYQKESGGRGDQSIKESELEILSAILLLADIPWWMDKRELINVSDLIDKLMTANPAAVSEWFSRSEISPVVFQRLLAQTSVATITKIAKSIPAFSHRFVTAFIVTSNQSFELANVTDGTLPRIADVLLAFIQKRSVRPLPEGIFTASAKAEKTPGEKKSPNSSLSYLEDPQIKTLDAEPNDEVAIPGKTGIEAAVGSRREAEVAGSAHIPAALGSAKTVIAETKDLIRQILNLPGATAAKIATIIFQLAGCQPDGNGSPAALQISRMPELLRIAAANAAVEIRKALDRPSFTDIVRLAKSVQESLPTRRGTSVVTRILKRLPADTLGVIGACCAAGSWNDLPSSQPAPIESSIEPAGIFVENAGLCLLAPFLPALFKETGLMEAGLFTSHWHQHRAAMLCQYLVQGSGKTAEYQLQLNKVLCGLDVVGFIEMPILTSQEKAEARELLRTVINYWKALRNTSLNGFRSSFLKRKGVLRESPEGWVLQVERKSFDLLLDTVPWGYKMIKFSWMKKVIAIEWE